MLSLGISLQLRVQSQRRLARLNRRITNSESLNKLRSTWADSKCPAHHTTRLIMSSISELTTRDQLLINVVPQRSNSETTIIGYVRMMTQVRAIPFLFKIHGISFRPICRVMRDSTRHLMPVCSSTGSCSNSLIGSVVFSARQRPSLPRANDLCHQCCRQLRFSHCEVEALGR